MERKGLTAFKGDPLTLVGPELKVGDPAPDFTALSGLNPVSLKDSAGHVRLISAVPSLDTPVCEQQTRRFNEEAAKLPGVKVLTLSCDLPFAQNRFCSTAGIQNLQTLSDYRDHQFGLNYGVLIKELKLLARSIFVVGKDDKIKYVEIVPEVTQHPDYDRALAAAKAAA
ncbi:MAG: thiol peroxidase [Candidatus Sumerlaeia bacterium]|nr:thiol peroxidase [Candidatus Sumerlaeia bacterium]